MADKHKDKRQKVVPPTAPKTHASRSSSVKPGNYARSRSMSDVAREQTPLSGKSALATRAYPTPELTARKSMPRADSSELSSNRLPPLDLGVVSTPRSASRGITHPSLSDSDDARIGKQVPPKIKHKKSVLPSDSDDSDDNPSVYMKSKAKDAKGMSKVPLKYGSDLEDGGDQDPDEGQGSERDEDQGSEGSDEEGDRSLEEVDEDEDAGPSTTKSGVKASIQKGNKIHAHYTKARRAHALTIMLDMCGLDQAHKAGKLELPRDESGNRIHFVNNILIPHLDQSFKSEWNLWGGRLVKLFRDPSRMPSDRDPMITATDVDIRKAVQVGVWGTMRAAYNKYQIGQGDAWLEGKRTKSRNWQRRTQKAESRMKALTESGLNIGHYKFVGDPNFQSDEENDPLNSKHRIVNVPTYRTDDCTTFLGALDVASEDSKPARGNQQLIKYTYLKVNVEVPKLKSGDIPRWVVSQEWEKANPDLERTSRRRIDSKATKIPKGDAFRNFIHRYEPRKRTYSPSVSTSIVTTVPVAIEPEPTAPATVDKAMPDDGLITAGNTSLPASVNPPTSGLVARPGSTGAIPPVSIVGMSVEQSAPTSTPAPSEPHAFAPLFPFPPPPDIIQPPPGPNFNPAVGQPYAQSPYTQVAHMSGAGGQYMYLQIAEGQYQWVWVPASYQQPGNPPLVPPQVGIAYMQGGQQGAGVQVAHVGFPLDPNLANPPTQPSQFNAMPPPPEITHSTLAPELPEAEWVPSAKKKNSKHKANEGGKGSKGVKRKGKPKKSRETIEVGDEGEDADEAIAGPSHLPPNAGHPSKLHLTFKGN